VRLSAPPRGLPPRNASIDPLGSPGEPNVPFQGIEGQDYRWEHLILVMDSQGNLVESWTQWDKLIKRPHKVLISPYDPEKRVWVVDDGNHAIYVFSNDGKKLLQTIGTRGEKGEDATHFGRQTDIAWLPDGTFFVSDGYENTRVVKFDRNGKFLTAWGQKGEAGKEMRPGYFNTVHGIAVDAQRRVYVVDRSNRRIQVFDENGKFLKQWYLGPIAATYHIYISADQYLWMSDGHGNYKFYKYDLNGRLLYTFGGWGPAPGQFWGAHQFSVDQEGNLYVAEVFNGRAQKLRPRKGADPSKLVGQPVRAAWSN
jgi:DNA-binding beta-propeller fold protein YncE